ncbi:transmembrane protein 272-like [Takifugu flavidus]|uniref:transmembrane protein 272-like n=1 Tax=Takifugu flavidus TaxID=433684 RepID=UPI00254419F0|nr:transmembrane protein 272-like [Takifugu flavidus]XP_056883433.1 transmembrane protein 272-like [Takifugu flavidus]
MLNIRLLQRVRNPLQPPTRILVCSKVALCIMPVTQIAIGAVHLDDCPREPYIPIYLIVSGVFSLALALLSCLPCSRQANDEPTNPLSRVCTAWNSLTTFFLFCWFVVGYVWIYSIYEPNYNKTATAVDPYCDRTLYLFALGTTALVFILLGLVCVVGCCVLVCLWLLV